MTSLDVTVVDHLHGAVGDSVGGEATPVFGGLRRRRVVASVHLDYEVVRLASLDRFTSLCTTLVFIRVRYRLLKIRLSIQRSERKAECNRAFSAAIPSCTT